MPKNYYENQTYTIESTAGEADYLFGKVDAGTNPKPRLKITFDQIEPSKVIFEVFDVPGTVKRDFAAEAKDNTLFFGDLRPPEWPDDEQDMIIGHINYGNATQQLFMLWVRPEVPPNDPKRSLRFNLYFFKAGTRFSNGNGPLIDGGIGQASGGGSGHGPN